MVPDAILRLWLAWIVFLTKGTTLATSAEKCDIDDLALLQLRSYSERGAKEVPDSSEPEKGGGGARLVAESSPYAQPEEPPQKDKEDPELAALRTSTGSVMQAPRPEISSGKVASSPEATGQLQVPKDLAQNERVGLEFEWSDKDVDNKDSPTIEQTTSDSLGGSSSSDRPAFAAPKQDKYGRRYYSSPPPPVTPMSPLMAAPVGRTSTFMDDDRFSENREAPVVEPEPNIATMNYRPVSYANPPQQIGVGAQPIGADTRPVSYANVPQQTGVGAQQPAPYANMPQQTGVGPQQSLPSQSGMVSEVSGAAEGAPPPQWPGGGLAPGGGPLFDAFRYWRSHPSPSPSKDDDESEAAGRKVTEVKVIPAKRHVQNAIDHRLHRLHEAEELADHLAILGHILAWWAGAFEHQFTEFSVQLLGGSWAIKLADWFGFLRPSLRAVKSIFGTLTKSLVKDEDAAIKQLEKGVKTVVAPR